MCKFGILTALQNAMKFWLFVFGGVVVHVIQFLSIFDIYFTSPLVKNIEADQDVVAKALSKRLVLFVGDGLRADTFFGLDETGRSRAPFLRNIVENEGSWGISHTHIPTESRPGHVALIAGFYEDVSAVMKGWKENPVEFDSVFNRSRETWSWGSPDILPMFAKGVEDGHVHTSHYDSEYESFVDEHASKLDIWVFEQVTNFFNEAKNNETLKKKLNNDKLVFFLHLLGLDTNGHSNKPKSSEYQLNLKTVDEGVKNITNIMEEFYENDGQTAYIFTADHGMTDWGTHGAGDPSETETPLVAWGAGVAKSATMKKHLFGRKIHGPTDETITSWNLNPRDRVDVEQADVAPLMSALIGVSYPVNSVGFLPSNYLSCDEEKKALLLRQNAKEINQQFLAKMKNTKGNVVDWLFKSFPELSNEKSKVILQSISSLISSKNFEESMEKSSELMELSLKGLRYFHTYHRMFLYLCVVLSSVGWIVIACISVMKESHFVISQSKKIPDATFVVKLIFVAVAVALIIGLTIFNMKWSFYIYCLQPCVIWYVIFSDISTLRAAATILSTHANIRAELYIYAVVGICGVTSLVASFFYRAILSVELFIFAAAPKFSNNNISNSIKHLWAALCCFLAIFPLLPAVGRDPNMYIVLASGCCISIFGFILNSFHSNYRNNKFVLISFIMPSVSALVAFITAQIANDFEDVPWIIHIISWLLLLCSFLAPVMQGNTLFPDRLLLVHVWLSTAYMLLCLSYDALFFFIFSCLLFVWIHLEYSTTQNHTLTLDKMDFQESTLIIGHEDKKSREPNFSDIRRSYMLVFFLVLAFFGVGNIASINSFDVRVVFPFLTIFNPFVMGALLAYKVLLPYLLLVCSFSGVAMATRIPFRTICAIVMVISDVMSLIFIFLVRDEGSWLDIGTSISHFVIVMSMNLALLVFFGAAKFLTAKTVKLI